MIALIPEREALWASVLANPADAAPLLVFADWLMERGEDAELEAGLRWAAGHGKWPKQLRDGYGRWAWKPGPNDRDPWIAPKDPDAHYRLPFPLWRAVCRSHEQGNAPGNRAKTVDVLIRRLGRARMAPDPAARGPGG